MMTAENRLVVNEIESIEAMYSNSPTDDQRVLQFLITYWSDFLDESIHSVTELRKKL